MAIKVYWTHFAKTELKSIFDYYKINVSLKIASSLVSGIVDKGDTLISLVKVGQKEEFLADRKEEFRYLIFKNYKIIYWINKNKNRVEITDVFDVRQNPLKLKRQK